MPELLAVAGLGLAAGLGVAVPLGPIGLLILDRAMRHGRRLGLAAAAGVATTDLLYGSLAVAATASIAPAVAPVQRPVTFLAAGVIALLGLRGLLDVQRRASERTAKPASPRAPGHAGWTLTSFAGLTAINPATLLYFASLAVALAERLHSSAARVAFVLGIALASFAWQAALALVGARVGKSPRPNLQRRSQQAGSLALLGFAVALAAKAVAV